MGMVYAFSDIEHGRVPRQESYGTVADDVRSRLQACPGVIGAILFGSVLRGDFTVRSDVDVFAIYDAGAAEKTLGLFNDLASHADTVHVPLNMVSISNAMAIRGQHRLGGSFLRHLQWAVRHGGVIKKDPLDGIHPVPLAKSVVDYMTYYLDFFAKKLSTLDVISESDYYLLLEKTLGAPRSVARHMCIGLDAQVHADCEAWSIFESAYVQVAGKDAAELLHRLARLNDWYTGKLLEQLCEPDEGVYNKTLCAIEDAAIDTMRFVERNAELFWQRKVRERS